MRTLKRGVELFDNSNSSAKRDQSEKGVGPRFGFEHVAASGRKPPLLRRSMEVGPPLLSVALPVVEEFDENQSLIRRPAPGPVGDADNHAARCGLDSAFRYFRRLADLEVRFHGETHDGLAEAFSLPEDL